MKATASTTGWLVLVGAGHPVWDDDMSGIIDFRTEAAALAWIAAHPKAKNAHAMPLKWAWPEPVNA